MKSMPSSIKRMGPGSLVRNILTNYIQLYESPSLGDADVYNYHVSMGKDGRMPMLVIARIEFQNSCMSATTMTMLLVLLGDGTIGWTNWTVLCPEEGQDNDRGHSRKHVDGERFQACSHQRMH